MSFYIRCSIPLMLLPIWAQAQVTIDAPRSGWRNSAGATEEYTQAQIRGRIAGAIKGKPATLVVNGVAMPMEVGEDGSYGRPYGFGSGSNSVEVRSPDGRSRARTQFVDSYQGKTQARLRIVLSWDSAGTDLDLHVVTPDGGHAWYGNRVLKDGGALDVDVTTGYGPEIFSSAAPLKGNYHAYVSGENTSMLTVARLSVITNEGTPREKLQSFQVPMRAAGELTLVKSFVLP